MSHLEYVTFCRLQRITLSSLITAALLEFASASLTVRVRLFVVIVVGRYSFSCTAGHWHVVSIRLPHHGLITYESDISVVGTVNSESGVGKAFPGSG